MSNLANEQKKLREDFNNLVAFTKEAVTATETALNRFNMEGLIPLQKNFQMMWNVNNGFIRLLTNLGIEKGWWKDKEEMNIIFTQAVEEVATEALEHRRKEMERIQLQQSLGLENPDPIGPDDTPLTNANKIVADSMSDTRPEEDRCE